MSAKLTAKKEIIYKNLFLKALEQFNGMENIVYNYLINEHDDIKITWRHYYKLWYEGDLEFKTSVDFIKNSSITKIENVAWQKALQGDNAMLSLILKSKGNYTEKTKVENETTLSINQPIKINIIKPE